MASTRGKKILPLFISWHVPPSLDPSGDVITPGKWVVNPPGVIDRPDMVDRFRETLPPFQQDKTYVMNVYVPVINDRLDIDRLGSQIAGPGAERSANAALADIDKLPTFYEAA